MTDYVIPCEPLARLMRLASDDNGPWFNTVRYDNGVLVVTNLAFMVCEYVGGPAGVFHILNEPALMAQCTQEAQWSSSLHITVIPELQIATGKTTLGYVHPNVCYWSDTRSNKFDHWRDVASRVAEPVPASVGGMYWNADQVALLASLSPSGCIVFEECVDVNRGVLVRDTSDANWFAMFSGYPAGNEVAPAVMPTWFVRA